MIMGNKPDWLPNLIEIAEYNGNWDKYLDAIYQIFRHDFINDQPIFRGCVVNALKPEIIQGKEATFWHIIEEGEIEEDRNPDFERCKRIRWPRSIIEKGVVDPVLQLWETSRGRDHRILIRLIFTDNDYMVVLVRHRGNIYLLTAYLVTWPNQKRKLNDEYEAYKKANAAF